jgi:16S rRNA A1518/A1519 N6-dimethyltransferase RsmA/KsgA/DIM1 with predicted DNA glycosylase/AP lyase activity
MYVAPFVQTPPEVVERMLVLAEVREGDILYDLGSGNGRIVLTAARRHGITAVGFEVDPDLVADSRKAIADAGLEDLAEICTQDIFTADLTAATVLTLYLYPRANLRLRPRIPEQLRPGARVVSHEFGMGAWKPARVERVTDESGVPRTLYL